MTVKQLTVEECVCTKQEHDVPIVVEVPLLDTSFSYNSSVSSLLTHSCGAAGGCNANTTGFLFWPDTLAGTTLTLPCPNTTTMISRTCSQSGVWESVDPSLCTSLTSINTVSFSVGFSIDFQCGVA